MGALPWAGLRLCRFSTEHNGGECLTVPNGSIPSFPSLYQSTGDRRHVCAVEGSPSEVPPMVPVAGCAQEEVCGTPPTDEAEPGDLLYERLMQKSHKLRESLVRSLLTSEEVCEEVERRGRDLEGELEDERVSPEQR